jgi:NhaC family Na+:H+ antiporter
MGTAFGTAATMGVITMAIANTMGLNPVLVGGAVVSGVFFGDRCSPISTSALLVATITHTNIFDNIKRMFRTAAVPFILSCVAYYLMGYFGSPTETHAASIDIKGLFSASFNLHWVALLPAIAIFLLSIFRVKVRMSMSISIVIAIFVCIFLQGIDIAAMPRLMFWGFYATDAELAKMLNGGGVISMVRTMAIICISSSYAGIFKGVNLLASLKGIVEALSQRITPFGGLICTSIFTSMIACNQTLAILLTHQLYDKNNNQEFAIDLENTVVLIAALIPWSIAAGVPLATVGAPASALLAACFLYIVPIYIFIVKLVKRKE